MFDLCHCQPRFVLGRGLSSVTAQEGDLGSVSPKWTCPKCGKLTSEQKQRTMWRFWLKLGKQCCYPQWHVSSTGIGLNVVSVRRKPVLQKKHRKAKWIIQMDNDPKHTADGVTKWLSKDKVLVSCCLFWPLQKLWFQPKREFVCRSEKVRASQAAYKLGPVPPVLSGRTDQNSSMILWESYGRRPKTIWPSQTVQSQRYQILKKYM